MAEPMDPQVRNKIIMGVLFVAALGYLTYTYVYEPRAEEIATMEERAERLETQNRTARMLIAGDGTDEVERRVGVYREQLRRVEGLIPSSEEVTNLLDAISAEARRSGVDLAGIHPMGATAERFYARQTYGMEVFGSYHDIGTFLGRIGSLPRIITPIDLNLTVRQEETPSGSPQLEASFSIETYVLPREVDRAE